MAFSLDDVKSAAAKKYAAFEIDTAEGKLTFRSILKLSDEERQDLEVKQKAFETLEKKKSTTVAEVRESLQSILRVVVLEKDVHDRVIPQLDVSELLTLIEMWGEETQAGKA